MWREREKKKGVMLTRERDKLGEEQKEKHTCILVICTTATFLLLYLSSTLFPIILFFSPSCVSASLPVVSDASSLLFVLAFFNVLFLDCFQWSVFVSL